MSRKTSIQSDTPPAAAKASRARVAPVATEASTAEAGDPSEKMLDAKTAASLLGVKTQTLYAYVSRGLIRSAPRRGTQASLYHREDVEALRLNGRAGAASGPPAVDPGDRSTRWNIGGALLQTAITVVEEAGPRYRGKPAVDLAASLRPFEDCVELLWGGTLPVRSAVWNPPIVQPRFHAWTSSLGEIAGQATTRQLLSLIAQAYGASSGRNPENALGATVLAGRQILQVLGAAIGLLRAKPQYLVNDKPEPLAALMARNAGLPARDETLQVLNACLILSADHELAPSTFAARIAASAGGDIFACLTSALGTFDGPLTGFACDESERLLRQADSPARYVKLLKEQIRRKEGVPGYNHPLYPGGDPRAIHLLGLARELAQTAQARRILECIDAGAAETGCTPSLAVGLVAVAAALNLPEESPGLIMAVGRAAGWVAHMSEQRLAGFMVRPRTKYVGPLE